MKRLRRWLQIKTGRVETVIDGEMPFWFVSLLFHLALLWLVAGVAIPGHSSARVVLSSDVVTDVVDTITMPPILDFEAEPADEIGSEQDEGMEVALNPMLEMAQPDFEPAIEVDLPTSDVGDILAVEELLPSGGDSDSALPVQGSVGKSFKSAGGAIDRLTEEILHSLEDRKTLVVWFFDQSASMLEQRAEIVERFDKVYKELGLLEAAQHGAFKNYKDAPLLTQVYAFGDQNTPLLKKPSAELAQIRAAVDRIERDDTGNENVMAAVLDALARYRSLRSPSNKDYRNVMLVIVSDEAGDDVHRLDETTRMCLKLQVPVYVIGVPAPFGRAETYVKWVDPDPNYDQQPHWARVSQGPESAQPERLRLDFTGAMDDLESIDSGFGPFHLTRLCYETGGIYFSVHPNRKLGRSVGRRETRKYTAYLKHFFPSDVMSRYKPDYISQKAYVSTVSQSPMRRAMVEAAAFTTTGSLESPQLTFPKFNEAQFVRNVSRAQQDAAIAEPQINRLYEMIRVGEADRVNEISPRWQAGFDLAMGQAIAAKVRTQSYNAMLAIAKTKLTFDAPKNENTPQNNTWVLRPDRSTETGSYDQKLIEKAHRYLQRVVDEHPDTPWALIASRELRTPMGWKWSQNYIVPPEERPTGGNGGDAPERRIERLPRRDVPKL